MAKTPALLFSFGALLFAGALSPPSRAAAECKGVQLSPGQDIQSAVNDNPEGTQFCLAKGTYRLQEVSPKKGDKFIGEAGAVLNGAKLLTNWTQSGVYWYVGGQTQEGQVHGECLPAYPRCNRPEDVFVNDQPLRHVDTLSHVGADTFYFDYPADRIYIGQNPAGKKIEVATARAAFRPTANNVTIRGLVIEKYAIPDQMGAIGDQYPKQIADQYPQQGWIIKENEIRLNHGTGVNVASNSIIRNNNIHHNGQKGIGAGGRNILIEGNEIAYNGWNGTSWGWEGGGTKFSGTEKLIVRNNYVHHNAGPGLWTDIDNINTLYEYNTVTDNEAAGIKHEISYDAVMRNNIIRRNGTVNGVWLWNGQFEVQNSQNVELYNNHIDTGAASFGHAVSVIEQARGDGAYGPWVSKNAYVHDNVVVLGEMRGGTGAVQDIGNGEYFGPNWNIRFRNNAYYIPDKIEQRFAWTNGNKTWAEWQGHGQDTTGSLLEAAPLPPKPIISLSATTGNLTPGQTVKLWFNGLLAKECTAPWKKGRWVSGSVSFRVTRRTTYTLYCGGEGGTTEKRITLPAAHASEPSPQR